MNDQRENPLAAWRATGEGQVVLRAHALRNIERIQAMPRCGARARSGFPCKQPGSGRGGRCVYHGGKSTAGETWGLRQWSDNPSPVVARRQMTKAKWVERAEADREQRLAAMTPEERHRYDTWRTARTPGSRDQRVSAKLEEAFGMTSANSPFELSIEELQARIRAIKEDQAAWALHRAIEQGLGVFG